jgi:anti-sigma regulatory factor (Ser/Thr protein kinase)
MNEARCTIRLRNDQTETERLCDRLISFGNETGLTQKTINAVSVAVEELFTNIISYGFRDDGEHIVTVHVAYEDGAVQVLMEDDGIAFNPLGANAPDVKCTLEQSKIGGLGIYLARKLMDDFDYERKGGKNIIRMMKYAETE